MIVFEMVELVVVTLVGKIYWKVHWNA